ncbi:hypothetical protein ABZ436_22690 [Micromonospora matsumotoense]|uniref:hypothetical protein n=1 Tax=Micromonospora matsumotoense TaxID=121616 RepID=UPI0034003D50
MSPSSDALMLLKPDILTGPYATCDRRLARDAVRGVRAAYDRAVPRYEVDTSAAGVGWGLRNVDRKVAARSWYTLELTDRHGTLARLGDLCDGPELAGDGQVGTGQVAVALTGALGFRVRSRQRRVCTHRDFLGLYAHNTHFTRLAGDLRGYLVGQPVEVLLLTGDQELSSLHVAKELLRRVIRYPTTHYDALENMLHVADPGAPDWVYFDRSPDD